MGFVPDLRAISGDTLRAVSDGAIEQLAGRFDGLPRPLLAAIGAGDLAVEHLAVLRESVRHQVDGIDLDGQEIVAAAAGVAASVQNFAGELPRRLQEMAAELPGRVAALTRATGEIDPTAVVGTLEAYTEAAGVIYGGLARRGDRIWSDVRGASSRPGSVVDATPDRAAGTVRAVHDDADPSPSSPRGAGGPASRAVPRRVTSTSAAATSPTTARRRPTVATTATTPAGVGTPVARRPVPPAATPAPAAKGAPVVTPAPLKPAARKSVAKPVAAKPAAAANSGAATKPTAATKAAAATKRADTKPVTPAKATAPEPAPAKAKRAKATPAEATPRKATPSKARPSGAATTASGARRTTRSSTSSAN